MTAKQVLEMELHAVDPTVRFTLNYCRNQFGSKTAKKVAILISEGHSVECIASPNYKDGFRIDGKYCDWKEI